MKNFFKKNNAIIADLLVYFVMTLIGIITIIFPSIGFEKPVLYSSVLFFILGFFSFGGYFYTKDNKKTYELLFFSMISIISGVYLFIFESSDISFALGTGYLMFSILNAVNKSYYAFKLKKYNNELWLLKAISVIVLLFISTLVVQNFYRVFSEVQTVIIGYYFTSYGIISFFEILLMSKVNPKAFKNMVEGDFSNNKMKSINSLDSGIAELNKIVKKRKKKKSHK